jgi:hypothetical protein
MEYILVSVVEHSHGKGVKAKIRGLKLRSGFYWHGVLKQKKGVKRELRAPGT